MPNHPITRRSLLGSLSLFGLAFGRTAAQPSWPIGVAASVPSNGKAEQDWARRPVVPNKVRNAIEPLEYPRQLLHPQSLLGRRLDLNHRGLLTAIDLDSYLRPYREGKRPFWPAGEYLGKFMQGFSRMYLYTGDSECAAKMQSICQTWTKVQQADGWLGTGDRWGAWDVWEHKYTLLGLLEQYQLTGDEAAFTAARRIGNLLADAFGPDRRDLMRTGSWTMGSGSVLEPMVYLYRLTAEQKYLRFCFEIIREFESSTGPKLIGILGQGSGSVYDVVDPMNHWHNGRKGYEMLSCLIGLLRMYQLTGNTEYMRPAERAWQDIVTSRLFVTGTATNSETFRPAGVLPGESADEVGEGCVSAHWIFLNRILLHISGDPKYADEIERTLYNHLLASKNPTDSSQAYFVPLNGTRPFELQNIWGGQPPCCLSSVARCIARTPESVWGKLSNGGFALLLYNRSRASTTVEAREGPLPVRFEVETDFPVSGNVMISVKLQKPAEFPLALRVPGWTNRFDAQVGGQMFTGVPGQFLTLSRRWLADDQVNIRIGMNDRFIHGAPSYPGYVAFAHGPQVLALDGRLSFAALGEVRADTSRPVHLEPASSALPAEWTGVQAYTSDNLQAEGRAILVPFSDTGQQDVSHAYRTWIRAKTG